MLLVGVDIHRNKPLKWKVENSWGTEVGKKGFFIMSDEWFDEHVYQIIIPSTMLDDEIIQGWQQEPVVLPMWHPMF
jgi:bleomycin hydrolase